MKLIISSTELLKACLTVSKAIGKSTEPILEDLLFDLKNDVLTLTASDKEITLITKIKVESTMQEGKIAIPAIQFIELLKELPDQPIQIVTMENNSFECIWNTGKSKLPYFNSEDYPEFKYHNENAQILEIPSNSLINGISHTIFATCDDSNRLVMNHIFFDVSENNLTLVASDMQKLVCYNADDIRHIKADKIESFILNKKHASIISAILKTIPNNQEVAVSISYDDKNIVFNFGDTTVISSRILGNYPNYKTIIPKNNSNILKIHRLTLLNIARRMSVCSPKASLLVKFELKDGLMEAFAQDTGYEMTAEEKVECSYDGDPLTVGMKASHIIDILSNLSADEVLMKFADNNRSILVLPSEDNNTDKVYGIIMPMAVK